MKVLWIHNPAVECATNFTLVMKQFYHQYEDKETKKDVSLFFYNYKNKNIDPLPRDGKENTKRNVNNLE